MKSLFSQKDVKFKIMTTMIATLLSVTAIAIFNTTNVKAVANTDSSQWPTWHQTDQPWAAAFTEGGSNVGCYVTSEAIQAARGGIKTDASGKSFNPGSLNLNMGGTPFKGNKGANTFERKVIYPQGTAVGTFQSAPAMGAAKALEAIKAITKQGYYPIIHMSGPSGLAKKNLGSTHYMSMRLLEGKTISLYDPARKNGQDYISWLGGQTNYQNSIAWVEGWGGGTVPFGSAKSPAADDASKNTSGKESSNTSSNSGSTDKPAIKPIFNPFVIPTDKATNVGYDSQTKNSAFDRTDLLAFADGTGDTIMTVIQYIAAAFLYIFLAIAIISFLLYVADDMLGGIISSKLSESDSQFVQGIFFPNGSEFMGFRTVSSNNRIKSALVSNLVSVAVVGTITGLIATRSLSIILGQLFYQLPKLFASFMN